MTEATLQSILQDYRSGTAVGQITKQYHISSATLTKLLRQNNIPLRKSTKTPSNHEMELYRKWTEGTPKKELANIYQLTISEVQRVYYKVRDYLLITDFDKGMSPEEMSDKYSVTMSGLYKILHKYHRSFSSFHRVARTPKKDIPAQDLIEDYQNGMKMKDIISKYNTSFGNVNCILKENHIEFRHAMTGLTASQKEALYGLYTNTLLPLKKCTNQLNLQYEAGYRYIRKTDAKKQREHLLMVAYKQVESGMLLDSVASAYSISAETLKRKIQKVTK